MLDEIASLKTTCSEKPIKYRSSHSQTFFKITTLEKFAIFTREHLCWSLFVMKLQPWRPAFLLKRDSNTVVFLSIFQNLLEQLFYSTPLMHAPTSGCYET